MSVNYSPQFSASHWRVLAATNEAFEEIEGQRYLRIDALIIKLCAKPRPIIQFMFQEQPILTITLREDEAPLAALSLLMPHLEQGRMPVRII